MGLDLAVQGARPHVDPDFNPIPLAVVRLGDKTAEFSTRRGEILQLDGELKQF